MTADSLKRDLVRLTPDAFVSLRILECHPSLFGGDELAYFDWRRRVGQGLGVDPSDIILVGSAATGFSLSPQKQFRPFGDRSDIDVAVVSHLHFEIAWDALRRVGAKKYDWPRKAREALDDHRERLIYWGTIATDRLLAHLPYGADWAKATSPIQDAAPVDSRRINYRIYRDMDSLRAYQKIAVTEAANRLLAKKEGGV